MIEIKKHILERSYFYDCSKVAEDMNLEIYIVGGYIRDLILDRQLDDIDILVVGDGLEFAKNLANKLRVENVSFFKNFGKYVKN